MSAGLHVGMDAGYFLETTIAATVDFPTADITSATFVITKKAGSTISPSVSWSTSIMAQSSESLTLRHVFNADGSDLDVGGLWTFHVHGLTAVSGVTKRTEDSVFQVTA